MPLPIVAIVGGAAARTLVSAYGKSAATAAAGLLYKHGGNASRAINAAEKNVHQSGRAAVVDAIRGAKRRKFKVRHYHFASPQQIFKNPGKLGAYHVHKIR